MNDEKHFAAHYDMVSAEIWPRLHGNRCEFAGVFPSMDQYHRFAELEGRRLNADIRFVSYREMSTAEYENYHKLLMGCPK